MIDRKTKAVIDYAMRRSDYWCLAIRYQDAKGTSTERKISPIRWRSAGVLIALCLGRAEPRQFDVSRITDVRLVRAADVLMGEGVQCERVSGDGVSESKTDEQ